MTSYDQHRHQSRSARRLTPGPSVALVAVQCAVAVLVAACGSGSGKAVPPASAASASTGRPTDFAIAATSLPPRWRDSNSQGLDYRVTVCGVDLEPKPPLAATSLRFAKGPVGPFLEQHIRTYSDDQAARVIRALQKALPGCTRYEAKGSDPQSRTATFRVEPLTVEGATSESVSWRQTTQGRLPITSDLLLTHRGNTAVLFMSYVIKGKPDPAVLAKALEALPQRP